MIQANELRIGNWVYITDTLTQLFYKQEVQINIHNLMYLCGECKEPFELNIEPIPITEEWLLKFGFKEKKDNDGIFGFKLKNFWYINEYQFRLSDFIETHGMLIDNKIHYVHQLQNLYFALTNQELTIKP